MIDLHTHILPGLDDGAPDLETSLAMARMASVDGTTTVVATPHVNFTYSFPLKEIGHLVEELNAAIDSSGLALEVVAGAELDVTRLIELSEDELRRLSLGRGSTLLVESPFALMTPLENVVFDLQLQGFIPVLAHPERCPAFQQDDALLRRLVERALECLSPGGTRGDRASLWG